MLKIALDLDGTITYAPEFFRTFTEQFYNVAEIHIVTCRPPEDRESTERELKELGIKYHYLALERYKIVYCLQNGINAIFEDDDEFFLKMPKDVVVFKVRQPDNFDFRRQKWYYNDENGVHEEDL